jgi:hypothetical protein
MQTMPLSATPRFCHPAGVRALLGPVSGGVATRHAPATGWVPSGNRTVALTRHAPAILWRCLRHLPQLPEGTQEFAKRHLLRFLKGTQRVAGRWRSVPPPVSGKKRDAPREGVPEGCDANNAFVSDSAPLSPRRGEGPFGARVRWCRYAPRTGYPLAMPPASPAGSRRERNSGFRGSGATSSAADAKVSGICREMGTGEPGFRKAEIVRHDLPGTIKTIPFAAPSTAHRTASTAFPP